MRPNIKKAAKRVVIAGAVLIGGGTLPVIPSELVMDYAYQYKTDEQSLLERTIPEPEMGTQSSTMEVANTAPEGFLDDDGNGVVSVATYTDSKGNRAYVQIDDQRYWKMGQKGGQKENPKDVEHRSLFDELVKPRTAEAATARDTVKGFTFNGSSATSVTFSHDGGSGSNRLTIGAIQTIDSSAQSTTATYNGTSMTEIAEVTRGSQSRYISLWYLAGSDTGTNNMVVNFSASTRSMVNAVTLTGVDQTTPLDDADSFSDATADTVSDFSMTATAACTWAVGFVVINSGSAGGDDVNGDTLLIEESDIYMLIEDDPSPVLASGAVDIGVTHPTSESGGVAGLFAADTADCGGGGGGGRRIIRVTGPW